MGQWGGTKRRVKELSRPIAVLFPRFSMCGARIQPAPGGGKGGGAVKRIPSIFSLTMFFLR